MKFWPIAAAALALTGCSGEIVPAARPAGHVPVPGTRPAAPVQPLGPGAAALIGQTAPRLIAQLGRPQLDVSEGPARKLQFAGPICVLDAYLYPPARGRGEAAVTHIDARERDGSPIDPASCVAALGARRGR